MKHANLTDELQEKASLYAAGGLPTSEELEYVRHLQEEGCETCRREADKLKSLMALLAFSLPERAPSPEIRTRLIQQARNAEVAATGRSVGSSMPRRRWFEWVTGFAAVAATIMLVMVVSTNRRLQQLNGELAERVATLQSQIEQQGVRLATLTSPAVRVVTLAGQGTTREANGRIFWDRAQRRWLLYVKDLPQVAGNLSYQLWFVPTAGNPVSATVFNTDAMGSAAVDIPLPDGLPELKAAAVTTEPAGGLPQPSGAFALLGTTE